MNLSIGIGAHTATLSVADALLLRPLPYRLTMLTSERKMERRQQGLLSYLRWQALVASNGGFAGMAAVTNEGFNLMGRGDPEQILTARVSWALFDVLGTKRSLGRGFRPDEDVAGVRVDPIAALN